MVVNKIDDDDGDDDDDFRSPRDSRVMGTLLGERKEDGTVVVRTESCTHILHHLCCHIYYAHHAYRRLFLKITYNICTHVMSYGIFCMMSCYVI